MVTLNLSDIPADGWFPLLEGTTEDNGGVWRVDGALRTDAAMTMWLNMTEEPIAQFYTDYTLAIRTDITSYNGNVYSDEAANINIFTQMLVPTYAYDDAGSPIYAAYEWGPRGGVMQSTIAATLVPQLDGTFQVDVYDDDATCLKGVERFVFDSAITPENGSSYTVAKAMPKGDAYTVPAYNDIMSFNDPPVDTDTQVVISIMYGDFSSS